MKTAMKDVHSRFYEGMFSTIRHWRMMEGSLLPPHLMGGVSNHSTSNPSYEDSYLMLRYCILIIGVCVMSACGNDRANKSTTSSRSQSNHSSDDRNHNPSHHGQQSMPSAGDQSESDSDRRITREIRQALRDESTLSVRAKSSAIITIDGVVTLRGHVENTAERSLIEHKANEVSGVNRVHNNLEINQ